MPKVVTKVGDVFAVPVDDGGCKYFQYVANDRTQLNSDVIRAFEATFQAGAKPDLADVVHGAVQFYAHCSVNLGVKLDLWQRVGRVADLGQLDALFRDTPDHPWKRGEEVTVSENWFVWGINEPRREVGKLTGPDQTAEIGLVFSPHRIVNRLRTGEYGIVYPGYE